LLFAQTDLPSSNDVPATLEVDESQGGASRIGNRVHEGPSGVARTPTTG
jgi:hypothetical protein